MSRMKSVLLFAAAAALAFSATASASANAGPEVYRAYEPATYAASSPVATHARVEALRPTETVDAAAAREALPAVASRKRPVVVAVLSGSTATSNGTTFAGRVPGPGERLRTSTVTL